MRACQRGLLAPGAGGRGTSLRGLQPRLGLVQRRLADVALPVQFTAALGVAAGLAPIGFGLRQLGIAALQAGLGVALIDARDGLPGAQRVAGPHQQRQHRTAHLGRHGGLAHRLHAAFQGVATQRRIARHL